MYIFSQKGNAPARTRRERMRQIFGASTLFRSRFMGVTLFASATIFTLSIATLALGVIFEDGPEGSAIVDSMSPTADPSEELFTFGGSPEVAPIERRPLLGTPETLENTSCEDAREPRLRAGFNQVHAFLPANLEWIGVSTEQACSAIDVAMPDWFVLDASGLGWVPWIHLEIDPRLASHGASERFIDRATLMPVVRVAGFDNEGSALLGNIDFQVRFAEDLAEMTRRFDLYGACLDISDLSPVDLSHIGRLMAHINSQFSGTDALSCFAVDSETAVEMSPEILNLADRVVVKMFRAEPLQSGPVPMADSDWFAEQTAAVQATIEPERLVVMLGAGGRGWRSGRAGSERVGFTEAMRLLNVFDGTHRFAREQGNSLISFLDDSGYQHQVWMLDAASSYNQFADLQDAGITNTGIWGLGYEDAGVWDILRQRNLDPDTTTRTLSRVDLTNHVRYSGEGPFLDFQDDATVGWRLAEIDPDSGRIVGLTYSVIPTPYNVRRWGQPEADLIAITFDDGPDERFTGPILDILRENNVRATFFPIGLQMLSEEETLRRVVDEGHLIGSHTFFHSHLEATSEIRLRNELNLQSRLFAGITGHTPILFRAPYVRGVGPIHGDVAARMHQIDELGYILVGSEVVPPDWNIRSASDIADYTVNSVLNGDGNVVLLHDGGGDRAASVAALPMIITRLRAEGYEFVDLAQLAGMDTQALMPADISNQTILEGMAIGLASFVSTHAKAAFLVVIGIALTRSLIMLSLALIRGKRRTMAAGYEPPVTVIVPAYNEEKVIKRTVDTILRSEYSDLSIIVVNDGSTDSTLKILRETYGSDPRITILTERNQGKWKAATKAIHHAKTEIIVAIDADTLVEPDAIRYLVQKLSNPKVGAVAGNVKVGNKCNVLTHLQALEYVTAQNIDRRAFELANAMMVVPGAIGAWRVEAIKKAGYYSPETMTEDADLTISVLRAGYSIEFEERAYTHTEAPETIKAFLAQRLRWTLGMLQAGWKHRGALIERRVVGFWTLPDLLLFGLLMPLLAPIIDFVVLFALGNVLADLVAGRPIPSGDLSWFFLAGYFLLPAIDVFTAFTALRFERRESMKLLWYIPLQRVFYRQLLTYTVYRSLWRALTGRLASWSKLRRTASVTAWFTRPGKSA